MFGGTRGEQGQAFVQPMGPSLADRIGLLEDALNQLINQQVHANARQEDLHKMVHDVMSSKSKHERGKNLVDPEPSIQTLEPIKLKIQNIDNSSILGGWLSIVRM